jgi:hypothetical protein
LRVDEKFWQQLSASVVVRPLHMRAALTLGIFSFRNASFQFVAFAARLVLRI